MLIAKPAAFYICRMETVFSLQDIGSAARAFWTNWPDRRVFAFSGQLGAGKTTFIQALCREKNVNDTVSSPTFSLINEYGYPGGTIYHLDLYRLKDEEEAVRAGVEDCLYSGDLCLVEWPERAPDIFPPETLRVQLEVIDENSRKLTATAS
jgi:tRNA threonylcarbamoyladenosine biosynthesis protein TsaE